VRRQPEHPVTVATMQPQETHQLPTPPATPAPVIKEPALDRGQARADSPPPPKREFKFDAQKPAAALKLETAAEKDKKALAAKEAESGMADKRVPPLAPNAPEQRKSSEPTALSGRRPGGLGGMGVLPSASPPPTPPSNSTETVVLSVNGAVAADSIVVNDRDQTVAINNLPAQNAQSLFYASPLVAESKSADQIAALPAQQ